MTIQITWQIEQIDCVPQQAANTNIAQHVHYRARATDGTYHSSIYGTTTLGEPGEHFIQFEDLTQSQVVDWTQAALGPELVTTIQENLAKQIANQINPPIIAPPLPWANT
jgi:hypothetical protein